MSAQGSNRTFGSYQVVIGAFVGGQGRRLVVLTGGNVDVFVRFNIFFNLLKGRDNAFGVLTDIVNQIETGTIKLIDTGNFRAGVI